MLPQLGLRRPSSSARTAVIAKAAAQLPIFPIPRMRSLILREVVD
jgi:hypothetical protein